MRYFPAFQFEMNFLPETPSTRCAWASTIVVNSRRVTHFTPEVADFFVVTGNVILLGCRWSDSLYQFGGHVNSKLDAGGQADVERNSFVALPK